jgi:inner membrane protein
MDSLTHIVLGACVGEALIGKKIGKMSLLLGAVAQSLPDIDFVSSFWLSPSSQLLAHRGITHSLIFVLLSSVLMGFVSQISIKKSVPVSDWSLFFLLEMLIHLFLDAFNNYGIGWFEPFSKVRISFNTIYVADPIMTIFPLLATIVLALLRAGSPARAFWWKLGVYACTLYLCIAIANKILITRVVKSEFVNQHIPHTKFFTTPAPFQVLLWMVVVGDEKGYNIGYRSVFDSQPHMNFTYFPINDSLLSEVNDHQDVADLKTFSNGFYTVERWSDTLVFNDLRFGQIIGWHDPKEKFVFHYFLQHPEENELVVQRGRLMKWDRKSIVSFLKRIRGN